MQSVRPSGSSSVVVQPSQVQAIVPRAQLGFGVAPFENLKEILFHISTCLLVDPEIFLAVYLGDFSIFDIEECLGTNVPAEPRAQSANAAPAPSLADLYGEVVYTLETAHFTYLEKYALDKLGVDGIIICLVKSIAKRTENPAIRKEADAYCEQIKENNILMKSVQGGGMPARGRASRVDDSEDDEAAQPQPRPRGAPPPPPSARPSAAQIRAALAVLEAAPVARPRATVNERKPPVPPRREQQLPQPGWIKKALAVTGISAAFGTLCVLIGPTIFTVGQTWVQRMMNERKAVDAVLKGAPVVNAALGDQLQNEVRGFIENWADARQKFVYDVEREFRNEAGRRDCSLGGIIAGNNGCKNPTALKGAIQQHILALRTAAETARKAMRNANQDILGQRVRELKPGTNLIEEAARMVELAGGRRGLIFKNAVEMLENIIKNAGAAKGALGNLEKELELNITNKRNPPMSEKFTEMKKAVAANVAAASKGGARPPAGAAPRSKLETEEEEDGSIHAWGLPKGWKAYKNNNSGNTYYANESTSVTQWEHPGTETGLPSGWHALKNSDGNTYYANNSTGVSTYLHPVHSQPSQEVIALGGIISSFVQERQRRDAAIETAAAAFLGNRIDTQGDSIVGRSDALAAQLKTIGVQNDRAIALIEAKRMADAAANRSFALAAGKGIGVGVLMIASAGVAGPAAAAAAKGVTAAAGAAAAASAAAKASGANAAGIASAAAAASEQAAAPYAEAAALYAGRASLAQSAAGALLQSALSNVGANASVISSIGQASAGIAAGHRRFIKESDRPAQASVDQLAGVLTSAGSSLLTSRLIGHSAEEDLQMQLSQVWAGVPAPPQAPPKPARAGIALNLSALNSGKPPVYPKPSAPAAAAAAAAAPAAAAANEPKPSGRRTGKAARASAAEPEAAAEPAAAESAAAAPEQSTKERAAAAREKRARLRSGTKGSQDSNAPAGGSRKIRRHKRSGRRMTRRR